MKGSLLDTSIVSELRKGARCDAQVAAWYDGIAEAELYLSVLVVGEIRRGIERLRQRDPPQALRLEGWLLALKDQCRRRILGLPIEAAELWGCFDLDRPVPPIDGLLAATAMYHDLVLVTRHVDDVAVTGVSTCNPFDSRRTL